MFGTNWMHSLMTYEKKEFFKYSVLQGNTLKVLGCLWKFLIWGSKFWECDGCSVENTISSSIFFVGDTQPKFLIQLITKGALTFTSLIDAPLSY